MKVNTTNFIIHRVACSIQLEASVINTGGQFSPSRVQEYNLQGSVARLPDLNTGRGEHACGHFVRSGQLVSRMAVWCSLSILLSGCWLQVFVVTGGKDSAGNTLSSTETLTPGASQWQFVGQLPSARKAMRGVSIGGSFFVTGE